MTIAYAIIKYVANVRIHKQDRNGNTYHDVDIYDLSGNKVASVKKEYGYGRHYEQTAADMLNKLEGTDKYTYANVNDSVLFLAHKY